MEDANVTRVKSGWLLVCWRVSSHTARGKNHMYILIDGARSLISLNNFFSSFKKKYGRKKISEKNENE